MTLDIIKKAVKAFQEKRSIDSYDLPEKVKRNIANLHFSEAEINENYRLSRKINEQDKESKERVVA